MTRKRSFNSELLTRDNRKHFTSPDYQLRWNNIGKNGNISGFCYSGELFAFIGVGITKTNLLRTVALADSNKKEVNTAIELNSVLLLNATDKFTYIELPNFDLLYGNLTVLETLIFSAELRLVNPPHPSELSALRLLAEMGLNEIEDTKTNQLSIWQRRILLFATEVIAGRNILCFDQPTLDLDAQSALALITVLKRLARGNRLIAITISSLTFREYAVIDRIQLLSSNGSIYFGPAASALSYFESLNRTPFAGQSISDFLLDLVDDEFMPGFYKDMDFLEKTAENFISVLPKFQSPAQRDRELESLFNSNKAFDSNDYDNNDNKSNNDPFLNNSDINSLNNYNGDNNNSNNSNNNSYIYQFYSSVQLTIQQFIYKVLKNFRFLKSLISDALNNIYNCDLMETDYCLQIEHPLVIKQIFWCLWRSIIIRVRNYNQIISIYVFTGIITPVLFLMIFYQLISNNDNEDSIYSKLLFLTIFPFVSTLICSIWDDKTYYEDLNIFSFERYRGYYYLAIFPISSLLADIIVHKLLPNLMACLIIYPIIGLRLSVECYIRFIYIFILIILLSSCLEKMIYGLKSLTSSLYSIKASMINTLILSIFMPYSGPLINNLLLEKYSVGYILKNISIFYWGCNLLYINEFKGIMITSTTTEVSAEEYLLTTFSVDIKTLNISYSHFILLFQICIYSSLYCIVYILFHYKSNKRK